MADQPFSAGRFLNFESYWPTAAYSNLKLPLTSVLACTSGIERGERNVALINIKKIARALRISLPELFRGVHAALKTDWTLRSQAGRV
jgi:hypothetical protein